jgi:hypothetical protein
MDARDLPDFPSPGFTKRPTFVRNLRFDCRHAVARGLQRYFEEHVDNYNAAAHAAADHAPVNSTFLSIDATGADYLVAEHK